MINSIERFSIKGLFWADSGHWELLQVPAYYILPFCDLPTIVPYSDNEIAIIYGEKSLKDQKICLFDTTKTIENCRTKYLNSRALFAS